MEVALIELATAPMEDLVAMSDSDDCQSVDEEISQIELAKGKLHNV